jgi:hypothetical protein
MYYRLLTAEDRCQARACGAQAYVLTDVDGSDLLWCGHHWRAYADKLVMISTAISDQRPPEMRW